jgi:NADH dehydrogenase/NADH:ubiquinone oxidoreductase subunit G
MQTLKTKFKKEAFIVYQGNTAEVGVTYANVILPSKNHLEKSGYYLNCEGNLMYSTNIINTDYKSVTDEYIIYSL